MNYRRLGTSDIMVSEIGVGCEGLLNKTDDEVKAFVDKMEELGVNIIDLYTPNPVFRSQLGKALEGRRDRFVLQGHVCTTWTNDQYKRTRDMDEIRTDFDDLFERLGTDYLDIAMIHYVDSMEDWRGISRGPILQFLKDAQRRGMIGLIGLSSHNPVLAREAITEKDIDTLMFSINPVYDTLPPDTGYGQFFEKSTFAGDRENTDPERSRLYETCQEMGVGITVMKAFAGGDLLDAQRSPGGRSLTEMQCLHYCLTRPAVASVMCGANRIDELERDAAYAYVCDKEKDYAGALSQLSGMSWSGHCMYCGHCAPCPRKINVADVTKLLNLAKAHKNETPETVRDHYRLQEHHAGECIRCGACEGRCPFGVAIIENMKSAEEIFGY